METRLRIAVQKSGRLSEKSLVVLKECGISFSAGKNVLKAISYHFPAEILFLRDDDIPQYVADGVADIGILGENGVLEKDKGLKVVEKLGFAKCRMSLAIRRDEQYSSASWFSGKRIATSYPVILQKYLDQNGINAEIEEISGSVEIAPNIGLAHGICDIVSTGSTLLMNGLKEVETILKSEAVLVSNPKLDTTRQKLLDKLLFRIRAVNSAKNCKYILLNIPNDKIEEVCKLLPGVNSPSVLPLAKEGWSSVHSVIKEDDFWEMIDELKSLGAEGILVTPIEKMMA